MESAPAEDTAFASRPSARALATAGSERGRSDPDDGVGALQRAPVRTTESSAICSPALAKRSAGAGDVLFANHRSSSGPSHGQRAEGAGRASDMICMRSSSTEEVSVQ